jgi:hypothetical protein
MKPSPTLQSTRLFFERFNPLIFINNFVTLADVCDIYFDVFEMSPDVSPYRLLTGKKYRPSIPIRDFYYDLGLFMLEVGNVDVRI